MARNALFISYSHRDETWKDLLLAHLSPLEETAKLEIWNDRDLRAGDHWLEEITAAIDRSAIAILLISDHFLNSEFIQHQELPMLLQKEAEEGLRIVPLLAQPCDWKSVAWLQRLQLRPLDGKALSTFEPKEASGILSWFTEELSGIRQEYLEQFRRKLQHYLRTVQQDAERVPPYFPPQAQLTNIRVKVKVTHKGALASLREAQQRERILKAPPSNAGLYRYRMNSTGLAAPSTLKDPDASVFYWDLEVRDRLLRGVIVGDPGFGKSWLLRWEASRLAREALTALEEGADPDTLVYPVSLRLIDLAHALQNDTSTLPEAAADRLKQLDLLSEGPTARPDPELIAFFRHRIGTRNVVLLLDALDEVPQGQWRTRLLQSFEAWVPKNPLARLLITSRHSNYQSPWSNILQTAEEREVELLPFDEEQITRFIQAWFGQDRENADRMRQLIRESPQLRGMAELPLLLGFLCSLFQYERQPGSLSLLHGQSLSEANRSRLYSGILKSLLLRVWDRARPEFQEQMPRDRDRLLRVREELLQSLAFQYFLEEKVQFPQHDLEKRLADLIQQRSPEPDLKPSDLVQEFSQGLGILIEGGELSEFNMQFLFLHLTMQEYLSAAYLGRRINRQGWEMATLEDGKTLIKDLIEKKSWDSRWEQIFLLLAGVLDDPLPLIRLLMTPGGDDQYRHKAALAAHCLGEAWLERSAKPEKIRNQLQELRDSMAKDLYQLWIQHIGNSTGALTLHVRTAIPVLLRMQSRIAGRDLFEILVRHIREDKKESVKSAATSILIKGENELLINPSYVDQILESILSTKNDSTAEKLTEMLTEMSIPLFNTPFFVDRIVESILKSPKKPLLRLNNCVLTYVEYTRPFLLQFETLRPAYEASPNEYIRRTVADLLHQSKATVLFILLSSKIHGETAMELVDVLQEVESARMALLKEKVLHSEQLEEPDKTAIHFLELAISFQNDLYSYDGSDIMEVMDQIQVDGVPLKDVLLSQNEGMREFFQDEKMWRILLSIISGAMGGGGLSKLIRSSTDPNALMEYAPELLRGLSEVIQSGTPEMQLNALQAVAGFYDELQQYDLPEEVRQRIHAEIEEIAAGIGTAMSTVKDQQLLTAMVLTQRHLTSAPDSVQQIIRNIQELYQSEDEKAVHDFFRDLFERLGNPVARYDAFMSAQANAWLGLDADRITTQEEMDRQLLNTPELVDVLLDIYHTTTDPADKAGAIRSLGAQKQGDYRHPDVLRCIEEGLYTTHDLLVLSALEAVQRIGKSALESDRMVQGILACIRQKPKYAAEACRAVRMLSATDPENILTREELMIQVIDTLMHTCHRAKSVEVRAAAAAGIEAICEPHFRLFPQPRRSWWKKWWWWGVPAYSVRPLRELVA